MAKTTDFKKSSSNRLIRYFSENFKKQKVREIERNLVSVLEVSREYDVSTTAVYKWLNMYSAFRTRQVRQIIEPMSDTRKIKELKARIKELEQMVGQKQIQLEFKEKMIELAEQMYNVDIKKKLGTKRSSGIGSIDHNTNKK
jgi:transposase-like protein